MSTHMNSSTQKKNSNNISRRDLLGLAWKSLLGLASVFGFVGFWRFLSYQPNPARSVKYDLGPLSGLPADKIIKVPEAQAVLIPTNEGHRAFSLICPHLGCIIENNEQGFICPCHGSRFDMNGAVTKGPANRSLYSLQLQITEDGHLILDASKRG